MSFLSSLLSSLTASNSTTVARTYLSCNGDTIQFPVPPAKFDVDVKQGNEIININNLGELNMLGKTGLLHMQLLSFFPAQDYSFCVCTPSDPYTYVSTIDAWRTSGKPARVSIAGTPVNYAVSIDKFKWGEQDGTNDVYFTLDFTEYKFIGGAVDTTISSTTGLKDRTDASSISSVLQSVTVYPGDSIGDVVGRAVGKTASLGTNDSKILAAYKVLAKSGGVKVGDIVTYAKSSGVLKVNGTSV